MVQTALFCLSIYYFYPFPFGPFSMHFGLENSLPLSTSKFPADCNHFHKQYLLIFLKNILFPPVCCPFSLNHIQSHNRPTDVPDGNVHHSLPVKRHIARKHFKNRNTKRIDINSSHHCCHRLPVPAKYNAPTPSYWKRPYCRWSFSQCQSPLPLPCCPLK